MSRKKEVSEMVIEIFGIVLLFAALVITVPSDSRGSFKEEPRLGACFLDKWSGGCRNFVGILPRMECCRRGGFFVRKPNDGLLFLARLMNHHDLPNCEDPCGIDFCRERRCPDGDTCISRERDSICSSECVCSEEQKKSGPICTEDGPKYRTMCDLHLRNCVSNTERRVVPCKKEGCAKEGVCEHTQSCMLTLQGRTQCLDPQGPLPCEGAHYEPLCGVNNVTYPSKCHLTQAGVARALEIQVAYKGPCTGSASCSNVECPDVGMSCVKHHRNASPVCVTCPRSLEECYDPKYDTPEPYCLSVQRQTQNYCYKDFMSCQNDVFVEVIHSGMCLLTTKTNSGTTLRRRRRAP